MAGRNYSSAVVLALTFASVFSFAQHPAGKAQPAQTPQVERPAAGSHLAANPDILRQMNRALEELAARGSPSVGQSPTNSYGPLKENDKGQTALIVRQHAVGSGVIGDANGYIMPNAHVVEG